MYRPEGWATIRIDKLIPTTDDLEFAIQSVSFEAGADAMLEGLKNSQYRVAVSAFDQFTTDIPAVNGYLVFIPKE